MQYKHLTFNELVDMLDATATGEIGIATEWRKHAPEPEWWYGFQMMRFFDGYRTLICGFYGGGAGGKQRMYELYDDCTTCRQSIEQALNDYFEKEKIDRNDLWIEKGNEHDESEHEHVPR